jgi:hypothetical protein
MFTDEFRGKTPVQYGPATTAIEGQQTPEPADSADEEGEAQVLMRLKALGYIE